MIYRRTVSLALALCLAGKHLAHSLNIRDTDDCGERGDVAPSELSKIV